MQITDSDCAEFAKLCLEHEGKKITLDEARETLTRLCLLFERFHAWRMAQEATGRVFQIDEPQPDPGDI